MTSQTTDLMLSWGPALCGLQKHSEPLRVQGWKSSPSYPVLFIKGVKRSVSVVLMVRIVSMRQQFKNATQEIEKKHTKNPYD